MGWFHKGPIRNTTGHSLNGNFLVAGQRSSAAPRPGGWRAHEGLPPASQLGARVDSADRGLQVETAKRYVTSCREGLQRLEAASAAPPGTKGRSAAFFKSAARLVGGAVGIGMGAKPQADAAWERPDRPSPSTAEKKKLKKERAAAAEPAQDDGIAMDRAQQNRRRLQQQREQLQGVGELLGAGIAAAQARHARAWEDSASRLQAHQVACADLARAGRTFNDAERQSAALKKELRDLTTGLRSEKQQMLHLKQRLGQLGVQAGAQAIGRPLALQQRRLRAERLLQDCEAQEARSRRALRDARAAVPGGQDAGAAAAHREVLQSLAERHARHLSLRDRARAQVQRLAPAPGEPAAGQGLGGDEAARLLLAHEDAGRRWLALRQRVEGLLDRRAEAQPFHARARADLEEARRREASTDEAWRIAQSNLEGARQALRGLQGQAEELRPLAQRLDRPEQAANTQAALLRQAVRNQQSARLRQLLHSPPGFEHNATPELRAAVRALSLRLAPPDGMAAPETAAAAHWPLNDTLDAVSRALSLACGGDAALAAPVLDELMRRPPSGLVPPPGRWFDGSPRLHGQPVPPFGPLERLVGRLAELPCGAELLARVAAPESSTAAGDASSLKEAVAVYHQATRALAEATAGDSASWLWLQTASATASRLAHPPASAATLTAQQLASYHGVRNGFTSVCPGSAYEQANRQLLQLSDEWVVGRGRHNPLESRRKAAVVATQAGLPTPVRQSNEALLEACARLRAAIEGELVQAGRDAARQGRIADASVLEPLLEAAHLLRRIDKHAGDGLRLDEMRLGRKTWRSVDRHTRLGMKHQGQARPAPEPIQAEVRRAGLPQPPAVSTRPAPRPRSGGEVGDEGLVADNPWLPLSMALLELRVQGNNTTVPQALQAVRAALDEVAGARGAALAAPRRDGPLPTIAEEPAARGMVDDEMADDERDDIVEQSARELAESAQPGAGRRTASARARHPASAETQAVLDHADSLKPRMEAFLRKDKKKAAPTSAGLQAWMAPVVQDGSSSVSMNRGRSLGVGTQSVSSLVSRVANQLGVVARADIDLTDTRLNHLRWARQSRGMELFAGRSRQLQGRGGFTGGVGYAVVTLPSDDAFSAGAVGHWSASRSRTDTQGVLVRSPKYGGRSQDEVARDFDAMVDTVLNWRALRDADGEPAHSSPMQALLARHPQVSVSTIEQLRAVATTTRCGVAATVGGGGPMFKPLSGTIGFSAGLASERRRERTDYKTAGGSQGFAGKTAGTSATVSAQAGYAGQLGGNVAPVGASGNAAVRGRTSAAMLQVDLHRKQFQSSTTLVRQPDGTLVGEKTTEFNTFEAFEAEVKPLWDAWIDHGVAKGGWPEGFPTADRRLMAERELKAFMDAAARSVRAGGTVSLNQALEIRPEVCAELSACLALEELAQAQGRGGDASAMHRRRQRLLESDASYTPYKLKAIVRSQADSALGLDLVFSALRRQGASAAHEYDSFPKG